MQTITTVFFPANNVRGARMKATASAGVSLYLGYDHAVDMAENHSAAALELIVKLKWTREHGYMEWVGGDAKDGMVWVHKSNSTPRVCI